MPATDSRDLQHARQRRTRVLKRATILNGLGRSEVACSIRNMHEHGAEITVAVEEPVPAEFLLYVPMDGIAYKSVLRWRKGNHAGLEFQGTAPKPHWHYG